MCLTWNHLKKSFSAKFLPLYMLIFQLKAPQVKEKPFRTLIWGENKGKNQLISAIKIGCKQKRIGCVCNFLIKYSVEVHNSIFKDNFEEMLT